MPKRYLIVGAGLSGAVLANKLATMHDCLIDVWDERNHVAGNCHTEEDKETGIMVHKYGPHIFNTDRLWIWQYMNEFGEFMPYVHRVKVVADNKVYSFPINLHTINQFYDKNLTPEEAKEFIKKRSHYFPDPKNFSQGILSKMPYDLFWTFFFHYTKKQWGVDPDKLPAKLASRLPLRFNYDDNFHTNIYTGIPIDGYTAVISNMLKHPSIFVQVNKKFDRTMDVSHYDHVFYTGPLDAYFNYDAGMLGYRTLKFEKFYAIGDYQGTTQVNYCDHEIPYTRITEHKHFTPWLKFHKTICFKEFSAEAKQNDIPFYPKRLPANMDMLKIYRNKAEQLKNISFLGRLGTYRYMDMQHVVKESHEFASLFLSSNIKGLKQPTFPNIEI